MSALGGRGTTTAPVSPARAALALSRTCHPGPCVAVTVAATALAVAVGRGAGGAVSVAAAVLAGQLSVGWHNDYLDRERDVRAGRSDKPVAKGAVSARTVGVAAGTALVAAVPLSLLSGLTAGLAHLAAVGCAWAYNATLKATPLSVVPYTVAFGLLPAFVVAGAPGHPVPPAWLVAAGALLGSAAHFANTLPDFADDEACGVRGLPHRIGTGTSRVVTAVLLMAASVVLAFGPPGGLGPFGAVAIAGSALIGFGGLAVGARTGSRAAFRATMLVAVLDVALLLLAGHTLR